MQQSRKREKRERKWTVAVTGRKGGGDRARGNDGRRRRTGTKGEKDQRKGSRRAAHCSHVGEAPAFPTERRRCCLERARLTVGGKISSRPTSTYPFLLLLLRSKLNK